MLETQAGVIGELIRSGAMADEEVVARVRAGETALYEILMRRYNQRLYRVARGILGNDSEAEDVMQEAYVRAFLHLDQFEGRSSFSTWLTKIAVYEALMRLRRRSRLEEMDRVLETGNRASELFASKDLTPEQQVEDHELRKALEAAVDALPEHYRSVFVLRELEEMDTAETAAALGISTKTVKVRLHRARAFLRKDLYRRAGAKGAFTFHLPRCNRVVEAVFKRITAVG